MNNTKWNEMSSSDEDSWFDQNQKKQQPAVVFTKKQERIVPNEPSSSKVQVENKQKPTQNQPTQTKKKSFLSDQQLLQQYIDKKVDDTKALKIVACHQEDLQKMIKNLENAKVKEMSQISFIVFFNSEQKLIDFIKQKIQKRYKFYLHPFAKRQNNPKQEQQKRDRYQNKQRKPKRYNDDEPKYEQDKKKNYRPKNEQHRKYKQDQVKRQKNQPYKSAKIEITYEIPNNENLVIIKKQNFNKEKLLQDMESKKIFSNFKRFKIIFESPIVKKIAQLVQLICENKKYFVDKEWKQKQLPELSQIVLSQEGSKQKTVEFCKQLGVEIAVAQVKNKKYVQVKEKTARVIGGQPKQYFKDYKTNNISELITGFDEEKYVNLLKENHQQIYNKFWNSWNIFAVDENIQPLLQLVNRLKKLSIYEIILKPTVKNEKPLLQIQIKEKVPSERRPKVDVSGVNTYLN